MKAIQLTRPGPPDVLEYVDLPTPTPGPGQVLIRSHTIGVGIPDVLIRTGVYNWMPPLPAIMGIEVSGTVEAVGPEVQSFRPGQPVALYQTGGCYAEYALAPDWRVFPLPDGVDLEAAVTLPINYQTAYHVLHTVAGVSSGRTALVYAAAGGVGSAVVQLAKLAGLTVIGVAGSDEKARFAAAQGADHTINYRTESIRERVPAITGGHGVDFVFTPVGGESFPQNFELLAALGQVVLYGLLDGWPSVNILPLMRSLVGKSPGFRTFSTHVFDDRPDIRVKTMAVLSCLLAEGSIRPHIHARLPLAEAARAHEVLESGAVMGKLVLARS